MYEMCVYAVRGPVVRRSENGPAFMCLPKLLEQMGSIHELFITLKGVFNTFCQII